MSEKVLSEDELKKLVDVLNNKNEYYDPKIDQEWIDNYIKENAERFSKTQLMATPTLEGEDAERLLESLKFKPTVESIKNGEELVEFFKKFDSK